MASAMHRPASPTPTVATSAVLDAAPPSAYRRVSVLDKKNSNSNSIIVNDDDADKLVAAMEKKLAGSVVHSAHLPKAEKKKLSSFTTVSGRGQSAAAAQPPPSSQANRPMTVHVKPKAVTSASTRTQSHRLVIPDEHAYRYQYELHPLCYRTSSETTMRSRHAHTYTARRPNTASLRHKKQYVQSKQGDATLCAVGEAMHLQPNTAITNRRVGEMKRDAYSPTNTRTRKANSTAATVLQPLPVEQTKELYLRAAPDFAQEQIRYGHTPKADSLSVPEVTTRHSSNVASDDTLRREVTALLRRVQQSSTAQTAKSYETKIQHTAPSAMDEDEVRLIRTLHRASENAQRQRQLRMRASARSSSTGEDRSAVPANVVLPVESEDAEDVSVPQWRLRSPPSQQQQKQQQRGQQADYKAPYPFSLLHADNNNLVEDDEAAMNAWLATEGGDYLAWAQQQGQQQPRRPTRERLTRTSVGYTRRAQSASAAHNDTHRPPFTHARWASTRRANTHASHWDDSSSEGEEGVYGTRTARSVMLQPPAQVLTSAALFADSAGVGSPEEAELRSALRVVRDLLQHHSTTGQINTERVGQGSNSSGLSYSARLLLSLIFYIRALGGLPTLLEARPLPADSTIVHKEDCIELLFQRHVAITRVPTKAETQQQKQCSTSSKLRGKDKDGELQGLHGGVFNPFARGLTTLLSPTQKQSTGIEAEGEEKNTTKKEGYVNEMEQALLQTLSQVLSCNERRVSNTTNSTEATTTTTTTNSDATREAAAWLEGGRHARRDSVTQEVEKSSNINKITPRATGGSRNMRGATGTQNNEKANAANKALSESVLSPYEPNGVVSLVVRAMVAQKSLVTCFGTTETVHVLPPLPPTTSTAQANSLLTALTKQVESLHAGNTRQDVIADFLRPRSRKDNNISAQQQKEVVRQPTVSDALTVPALYGDLVVAFMLSSEASQLGGLLPAAMELEQLRYRVFRLHGYRNSQDIRASLALQTNNESASRLLPSQAQNNGAAAQGDTRAAYNSGSSSAANTFAQDLQRRFGSGPTTPEPILTSNVQKDKTRRLVDAAAQLARYFPLYRACCVSETTLQAVAEEERRDVIRRRRTASRKRRQGRRMSSASVHTHSQSDHLLADENALLCEEEKQLMRFRPLRLRAFYSELRSAARCMFAAHDASLPK